MLPFLYRVGKYDVGVSWLARLEFALNHGGGVLLQRSVARAVAIHEPGVERGPWDIDSPDEAVSQALQTRVAVAIASTHALNGLRSVISTKKDRASRLKMAIRFHHYKSFFAYS